MRRLLLSFICIFALPIAANAETVWLILRYATDLKGANGVGAALEKIQMRDMQECEMAGAKWMGSKPSKEESVPVFAFNCIKTRL